MAWESLEGSIVAHQGVVRFDPEPTGGTRVNVRFSYTPPAGAVGHAAAWLVGADAKQRFDDDLARGEVHRQRGSCHLTPGALE